jgi:hypothetical protein
MASNWRGLCPGVDCSGLMMMWKFIYLILNNVYKVRLSSQNTYHYKQEAMVYKTFSPFKFMIFNLVLGCFRFIYFPLTVTTSLDDKQFYAFSHMTIKDNNF